MATPNQDLLNLVNASGFLFQLRVEQEITSTQSKHGKAVLAREHPWAHPVTHDEGFIDLITTAGTNGKIIFECKRLRDAGWVFLIHPSATPTKSACILWRKRLSDDMPATAWDDFSLKRQSLEAEFCVVRGQADTQVPMLERLCASLLASVEALANEEIAYPQEVGWAGVRFYFPAIVTTAHLYICRADPAAIDLTSGELSNAIFEEVPYIRFTKSLPTTLGSSRLPSNVPQAARESRRTVFVVNASHLTPFLTGEWEFDPPWDGVSWPWNLPMWKEKQQTSPVSA
jgi:hypothetical protein